MGTLEQRRQKNIKRNAILLQELELEHNHVKQELQPPRRSAKKWRKLDILPPTRSSARIASASARPDYIEDTGPPSSRAKSSAGKAATGEASRVPSQAPKSNSPHPDPESIRTRWKAWDSVASAPIRDSFGTYHFASHPDFTPNKSPADIIREGCFGGSYWRPLYSQRLGITISDDWRELPADWTAGLDVDQYLVNPEYNAQINKHGVACGQSIEAWEASGWIAHEHDVRGWFQWYCRFWMGRRCADDERQILRWKRCVGETGRWRRTLLKQYVMRGIRSVFDDGEDAGEGRDVSPVVSQTCLHWAYEVRQEALDQYWVERR
ncbi:hypothetical protein PMIN06_009136 [Paraphaeosphaeria minitans]|uniref:Vegetatible incompatibility protein HET-E-1 n=1 Tax=Paraphaeosphaeria minitans TaxID=565426 RepID=A0A9P6KNY5_9PLEO|nr:hypothetical protein PMIN01_09133 [Paraphaeosphaeria minitans]